MQSRALCDLRLDVAGDAACAPRSSSPVPRLRSALVVQIALGGCVARRAAALDLHARFPTRFRGRARRDARRDSAGAAGRGVAVVDLSGLRVALPSVNGRRRNPSKRRASRLERARREGDVLRSSDLARGRGAAARRCAVLPLVLEPARRGGRASRLLACGRGGPTVAARTYAEIAALAAVRSGRGDRRRGAARTCYRREVSAFGSRRRSSSRLDPRSGLRRLFSRDALVSGAQSVRCRGSARARVASGRAASAGRVTAPRRLRARAAQTFGRCERSAAVAIAAGSVFALARCC